MSVTNFANKHDQIEESLQYFSQIWEIVECLKNVILIFFFMVKRVTIMIDDDIDKKLRLLQSKLIAKSSESVSYSKVINDELKKQLK